MACFYPRTAYQGAGKLVWTPAQAISVKPLKIPCRKCIGCRLAKASEWSIRCMHEAQIQIEDGLENTYITLTYKTTALPKNNSLDHEHFQKFIRALRQYTGKKIRYYMCGEYGNPTKENNYVARPHFHAILFGYQFPDLKKHKIRRGNLTYLSSTLAKIWTRGFHEIGSVTEKSTNYVARYIVKKQTGDKARSHYAIIDEHGEILGQRTPEYTKMSLKHGIGEKYYHKYKTDLFPGDTIILPGGRKRPMPRYYRDLLAKTDPIFAEEIKQKRIEKAQQSPDNTPERLKVREKIQQQKLKRLKREL